MHIQPVHLCPPLFLSQQLEPTPHLFLFFQQRLMLIASLSYKTTVIRQKINLLDKKIIRLDHDLLTSEQKIIHLEDVEKEKMTKLWVISKVIRKCLRCNRVLEEEKKEFISNNQFKYDYKEKISKLRQQLSALIDEELSLICEVDKHMQSVLMQEFSEKERYEKLYKENILPLTSTSFRSEFKFIAQAAANRGKAAQAGLQALKNLLGNTALLRKNCQSSQSVFLLPEQGVVFKKPVAKAQEEENIIYHLFDLISPQAIVGKFTIHQTAAQNFGIQMPQEAQARGCVPKALNAKWRAWVNPHLTEDDQLVLSTHATVKQDGDSLNYLKMQSKEWHILLPHSSEWQILSLNELQKLYKSDQLPLDAFVGPSQENARSLKIHILKKTALMRALNYLILQTPHEFYLSPNLDTLSNKRAYQLCEQFTWSYTKKNGAKRETDFLGLHLGVMKGKIQRRMIAPIFKMNQKPPTKMDLSAALNVKWKLINSELMHIENDTICKLNNIVAKPFVSEMILMQELDSVAKNKVLQQLTPDSEFTAILTGEMQLLDLHAGNLGIAPKTNVEYEYFKPIQFLTPFTNTFQDFKSLMIAYLQGIINLETFIYFEAEGKSTQKQLKDLPHLQRALDVRWQLVIFDADLSLTEDNRLQLQSRDSVEGHLIPLRSVFLETPWKDKPLSQETIERLMQSTKRDLQVKSWIQKEDAPIYKHLSIAVKEQIYQEIRPLLEEFTLSGPRKIYSKVTLKNLQKQFVQRLAHFSKFSYIWTLLENDLSTLIIKTDETWETLSARSYQTVEDLQRLNPEGIKGEERAKIKDVDLTSSKAALKRARIAAQLFPRLTVRQQAALMERQEARQKYLVNDQAFCQSRAEGEALKKLIVHFIQQPQTPLSSIEKTNFLAQVENQAELMQLKQTISVKCQPTYFNVMKAMYPLLADAYALNEAIYSPEIAGKRIGLYINPLEETIKEAKDKFAPDTVYGKLAQLLENQINAIKDPAFFGYW